MSPDSPKTGLPDSVPAPRTAPADVARQLAVLNQLLLLSTENIGLDEQLGRALEAIVSIPWLPTEPKGCIFIADTRDRTLWMAAHRGLDPDIPRRCASVAFGHCVCGRTAESREIGFIDRCDAAPPEAPVEVPPGFYSLPIGAREELLGVLSIYLQPGQARDPEEERFLVSVTQVLAMMIGHCRIEERSRALLNTNRALTRRMVNLQEEEHRRLARELHDEMGQSLAAIKADAALIINRCQTPGSPICQSAMAIGATADHLYDLTHVLIRCLRPSVLDDLGLMAALETYVSEWRARRPGLPCRLTLEGDLDGLTTEVANTAFRMVQEGLTNVLRHAAASQVHVAVERLRQDGDVLRVSVADDGRGLEAGDAARHGNRFGLLGMRERVEGLGGRLDLDSAPGRGLRLVATIPLAAT